MIVALRIHVDAVQFLKASRAQSEGVCCTYIIQQEAVVWPDIQAQAAEIQHL